jgi:GalNAc-alpha-(1->4)-GalNAc-alpha-(1->3)-diNAcBac-PP-undecaprenol alpha-1,4-N-acetyl-D-galactosaminyltransferase
MPNYYNRAKIFIHTSEREGFPNVVLEAMMCGLPCIVSNCGDVTDVAKDRINSLVIQNFDDYEGFTRAVIDVLKHKELYYDLSKNALQTMESLSPENVSRKWQIILANCARYKSTVEITDSVIYR